MFYRIFTEKTNLEKTLEIISESFPFGFTYYFANGYWQGKTEESLVIEVETVFHNKVLAMAMDIKKVNNQDAVLVQQFVAETLYL